MNPLTDVLPPQARKYLYAVLFVAGIVMAAWQASDGDWLEFAGMLVLSLGSAVAGSNVTGRTARHGIYRHGQSL